MNPISDAPSEAEVRHHAWNDAGRDFVVGDVHGCTDALRYLLAEVGFDVARDRLFSVGDLIDRGPRSADALALLDLPWCHVVRGNHEDALCQVAQGSLPQQTWDAIGGAWAQALSHETLAYWAVRLRQLPLARVIGSGAQRFNVLHAEFFGDDARLDRGQYDDATSLQMIWGRQLIRGIADPSAQRGLSPTFCGHSPVAEVTTIGAQVFVDTGAFATSGALTLFDVHAGRAYSVSTREARRRGANLLGWPGTVLEGG